MLKINQFYTENKETVHLILIILLVLFLLGLSTYVINNTINGYNKQTKKDLIAKEKALEDSDKVYQRKMFLLDVERNNLRVEKDRFINEINTSKTKTVYIIREKESTLSSIKSLSLDSQLTLLKGYLKDNTVAINKDKLLIDTTHTKEINSAYTENKFLKQENAELNVSLDYSDSLNYVDDSIIFNRDNVIAFKDSSYSKKKQELAVENTIRLHTESELKSQKRKTILNSILYPVATGIVFGAFGYLMAIYTK